MHTIYKILPTYTGAVPSDTAPAWPVTPSVEFYTLDSPLSKFHVIALTVSI